MDRLGKKPLFVDGLRVTDRDTADIAGMVLAGKVNKDIVSRLNAAGEGSRYQRSGRGSDPGSP